MYTRHICVTANERIAVPASDCDGFIKTLGELAEASSADGGRAVNAARRDGRTSFTAGERCGFVYLVDGTLAEILPQTKGGAAAARKALCAEFCRRCGFAFRESALADDMNFMEFFISVFAGETMKIIKSGVLSTYTSREENMNTVHGTILFSENIRRNLVHRERIYVRHDVFTPDRAENRIIKAAAAMLRKITVNSHSSHLLMEALSYLDEVVLPVDVAAEFDKCVNTRNTKKYSTILAICRMLFDKNEGTAFNGRNVVCAQLFQLPAQTKKR